ncbi:hypothetical protein [Chryseobacterium sp.]|uniref:hypothetical protein n=1 Tax=Chryseobacterium sp. TaxID=1871047 RepID=UPI0035C78224
MKKIVVCLIILGMISCNKKKSISEPNPQVKQKNEYLRKKDSISGNEYIFYYNKEKSKDTKRVYCNLDSIVVLKNEKKYVLNLMSKKISLGDGLLGDGVYDLNDYNFDGINDIMLYPHIKDPSIYNKNYVADFFIFNQKKDKYENKAELDTIPNLDICKKGKYLFSNDGVFLRKYVWKGDSLKMIETVQSKNNKFNCQ